MGEEPILYDKYNQVLSVQQNWQKTARIEHRLGAASSDYNPYLNVIYGLLNVVDAVEAYEDNHYSSPPYFAPTPLPQSLITDKLDENGLGAIDLFKASSWFSQGLNTIEEKCTGLKANDALDCPIRLGDIIKEMILDHYQKKITIK